MAEGRTRSRIGDLDTFSLSSSDDVDDFLDTNRRKTRITNCRFFQEGRCRFGDNCWNNHNEVNSGRSKSNQVSKNSAGSSRQVFSSRELSNLPKPDESCSYELQYNPQAKPKSSEKKNFTGARNPLDWANAPEFIPKQARSYADTLKSNIGSDNSMPFDIKTRDLCPHFTIGECPFNDGCPYVHGDLCELCGKACLNPFDEHQRKVHNDYCEKELEKDMELSFAIQRSIDKTCGICMDVIIEKKPISERRFGILEKCNHIFCLTCIRKWRQMKNYDSSTYIDNVLDPVVTRACPECRVASDFITPSNYWVDTPEEKSKVIEEYKEALSKKHCKYFKRGNGTCKFGGACFYLHAKPDGTKVDLPLPVRRRRQNQEELDYMGRILLWDYLEFQEENLLLDLDDYSESEEEESEGSERFFSSSDCF